MRLLHTMLRVGTGKVDGFYTNVLGKKLLRRTIFRWQGYWPSSAMARARRQRAASLQLGRRTIRRVG